MKLLSLSVLLGASLIAGALAASHRYTIERGSDLTVWRIDQWTGQTQVCLATKDQGCWTKPTAD